jgi:RNA polymerase sigma-70 factor, ECF subfamily
VTDQHHPRRRGVDSPRSASPDHELDPEALSDHIDRLYRAARSLCGSRHDAEDLVQETFARVLKKPRKLRSRDDRSYLLAVLHNTFISTHRAAARRPQSSDEATSIELLEDPRAVPPEDRIEAGEVFQAIAALPTDFRDAVTAVDVIGFSYHEAARALGVRKATITTRLHRGRLRLAGALVEPGPGSTASAVFGDPRAASRDARTGVAESRARRLGGRARSERDWSGTRTADFEAARRGTAASVPCLPARRPLESAGDATNRADEVSRDRSLPLRLG